MNTLTMKDLPISRELDREDMADVHGGYFGIFFAGLAELVQMTNTVKLPALRPG